MSARFDPELFSAQTGHEMSPELTRAVMIRPMREGRRYLIKFPGLKGAVSSAASFDDAIEEAADLVASWLESAEAEGRPIPPPPPVSASRGRTGWLPIAPCARARNSM